MGVSKRDDRPQPRKRTRTATTLEGREGQVVSMALDLAEKQIRDGTATSQVITHFLKLGSTREILEQDRLRHENEVLRAKVDAMASQKSVEKMYRDALNAMRGYSGQDLLADDDIDWDDDDD